MSNAQSPHLFSDPHVFEHNGEILADPGLVQPMNPHKANGELHQMHDVSLLADRIEVPKTEDQTKPTVANDIGTITMLGAGGAEWRRAASRVRPRGVI